MRRLLTLFLLSAIIILSNCKKDSGQNDGNLSNPIINNKDTVIGAKLDLNNSNHYIVPSIGIVFLNTNQNYLISADVINADSTLSTSTSLNWLSSDPNKLQVTAGSVSAKDSGSYEITIKDNKNNSSTVYVVVSNDTKHNDNIPYSTRFLVPFKLLDLNITNSYAPNLNVFNKRGTPIPTQTVQLVAYKGEKEYASTNNVFVGLDTGVYKVFAKFNQKLLAGSMNLHVIKNFDTTWKVRSVELQEYPQYFTSTSVNSKTVKAEVLSSKLTRVGDNKYINEYRVTMDSTIELEISDPQILSNTNMKLTALKPGKARIRAIKDDVKSEYKTVTVSYDFGGYWTLERSDFGVGGYLKVNEYPRKAIHDTYERNAFVSSDGPMNMPVAYPQSVKSEIYNLEKLYGCTYGETKIGFQNYCDLEGCGIFSSGPYKKDDVIGSLLTCDGGFGYIYFIDDNTFKVIDQLKREKIYVRGYLTLSQVLFDPTTTSGNYTSWIGDQCWNENHAAANIKFYNDHTMSYYDDMADKTIHFKWKEVPPYLIRRIVNNLTIYDTAYGITADLQDPTIERDTIYILKYTKNLIILDNDGLDCTPTWKR